MSELECEDADDGEEEGEENDREQEAVLPDAEEHRVQQAARARECVVERVEARARALDRLALDGELVEDADAEALRVAGYRERLVELVAGAVEGGARVEQSAALVVREGHEGRAGVGGGGA